MPACSWLAAASAGATDAGLLVGAGSAGVNDAAVATAAGDVTGSAGAALGMAEDELAIVLLSAMHSPFAKQRSPAPHTGLHSDTQAPAWQAYPERQVGKQASVSPALLAGFGSAQAGAPKASVARANRMQRCFSAVVVMAAVRPRASPVA